MFQTQLQMEQVNRNLITDVAKLHVRITELKAEVANHPDTAALKKLWAMKIPQIISVFGISFDREGGVDTLRAAIAAIPEEKPNANDPV